MKEIVRFVAAVLCWAALFALCIYSGGFTPWFLWTCLGMVIAYAIVVHSLVLNRIEVKRVVQHNVQEGATVSVQLTIRHRSLVPLFWVVVEDSWLHLGKKRRYSLRSAACPLFRSSFTVSYDIPSISRGYYQSAELKIVTGDLFGFAGRTRRVHVPSTLIVYPRLRIDERMQIRGLYDSDVPAAAVSVVGSSAQVSAVRDYVPGDAANRIDWKSSVRTVRLKTKQTETTQGQQLIVVLDTHRTADKLDNDFDSAVRLAAGVVYEAKRRGLRWGYADSRMTIHSQGSREEDWARVYEHLAGIEQDGEVPISVVLSRLAPRLSPGSAVICIADGSDPMLPRAMRDASLHKLRVRLLPARQPGREAEHAGA